MVDSDFLQRFSLSMLHGVWLTIFFKRDFTFGEHLTCRVKYLIFLLPIWLVVFLVNSSPLVLAVSVGTLLYVWKELQELAREEKVKCVVLGISLMLAYALDSEYLACIAVFCALTQLLRWPISLKKTLREFRIVFGPVYTIFIVGSCIQANFTSNLLKVAAILAFLASILLRPDNNETLKIFTSKVPSQPCRKMTHGFFMFLSFYAEIQYAVSESNMPYPVMQYAVSGDAICRMRRYNMSYAEIQYAVSGDAICRMQRAMSYAESNMSYAESNMPYAESNMLYQGLIPRQRNSSREAFYAKYGWLGMTDSFQFSHFFRFRSE